MKRETGDGRKGDRKNLTAEGTEKREEKKGTTPGPSLQKGGEPYPAAPLTEREGSNITQNITQKET